MKTLNEVVKNVGLTRRMIQEYERTGLAATPTTRNKYGHLLYDEKDIERLSLIRFYRELGYDKNQIREILNDPNHNRLAALRAEIDALDRKKARLEAMMQNETVAEQFGLTTEEFQREILMDSDYTYDQKIQMLNIVTKGLQSPDQMMDDSEDILTEEDYAMWWNCVESLIQLYKKRYEVASDEVQKWVEKLHQIVSKEISGSIATFSGYNLGFWKEEEWVRYIDKDYGEGSCDFIYQAIRTYCLNHQDNLTDRIYMKVSNVLESLYDKGYSFDCTEVQLEIQKLDAFFAGNRAITREAQIQILETLGKNCRSEENRKLSEDIDQLDYLEFVGKALEVYVKSLNNVKEKDNG